MFRSLIILLMLLVTLKGQSQDKETLSIDHLTGNNYVFITHRSFKGKPFPANGMYTVTKDGVVMIDTPWDTTQFQPLLDSIQARHHQNVVLCIATHSHEDRTGGLEYYKSKNIKTYTSSMTDSICLSRNEKRAEFIFRSDTTFKLGEYTFRTYYPGKGHTPDNIVVWNEQDKILYGGCLVKSMEANDAGNLADASIDDWPFTMKRLIKKYGHAKFVIPGHQGWQKGSLQHTLKIVETK